MTNKTWKRWSKEEDELLKVHWPYSDMDTLMAAFPDRTYNSLMVRATTRGVECFTNRARVNGDISMLKEVTKEAFYVWGFLMADGCFTTKNDITVGQVVKEKRFFESVVKLMGGKVEKIKYRSVMTSYCTDGKPLEMVYYRVGDKRLLDEMKERIGIRVAKTYNPPERIDYFFNKECFIHFMVGLIDGDGCVWNTFSGPKDTPWPNIRIEMHCSWMPLLERFSAKMAEFYGIESRTRMSNRGFGQLIINKKESVRLLYEASKLTVRMDSKWEKLDMYYA